MNTIRRLSACINFSSVVWSRDISSAKTTKLGSARLTTNLAIYTRFLCFRLPHLPITTPMATVQAARAHSQVKPPNVLILQPHKDSTNKEFLRIREALELCLTPERYVIYPLGTEEVQQCSPWQDNCRLLLVPPTSPTATEHAQSVVVASSSGTGMQHYCDEIAPSMSDKILQEIALYVSKGGVLLSMHSELNQMLGLDSLDGNVLPTKYYQHGVCNVAPTLDESSETDKSTLEKFNVLHISALATGLQSDTKHLSQDKVHRIGQNSSNGDQILQLETAVVTKKVLAIFAPIESDAALEWLDVNTNQSNNIPSSLSTTAPPSQLEEDSGEVATFEDGDLVCVRKLELEKGGKAVLSNVELFPSVPQDVGVKRLVWLKRGVEHRRKFLSSLLLGLGLECSEDRLPELTHTYLVCSGENRSKILSVMSPLLDSTSSISGSEMSARLITTNFEDGSSVDGFPSPPQPSELAILTNPAKWQIRSLSFDFLEYFKLLKTQNLGRSVLYTPVITSTQTLFTGNVPFCSALTPDMGVVSVAAQQTKGKGRSGNVWISPKGSMMFSMALHFLPTTKLAQRMPLLQHLVAMAVVHGIKTIPGYEEVPVCIKWPNDIYYKDKVKLGGILVSCFTIPGQNTITAVIGCGVNLSNQYPTMSVNDCITLHNNSTGSCLPPLSEEQALAHTLNSLELFLDTYQDTEMDELEQLYYKYWLHSGSVVRLASQGNEEVTILGIDDYGYLRVRTNRTKEVLSLQPDGNTFDIMKGLIATKFEL